MEKVARIFRSFEEAEEADRRFYASLTPQQRLDMMIELLDFRGFDSNGASQRLERVYRVVQREKR